MLYIPSLRLWHSNSQRCNDGLQLYNPQNEGIFLKTTYNPQNEGDGDFKTRGDVFEGFSFPLLFAAATNTCSQDVRTPTPP